MTIITPENKITVSALVEMTKKMFDNLVKAVVDVENRNRGVDDPGIRTKILEIVKKLIIKGDGK